MDTKPDDWRARARRRCWFVRGIEVKPRRAREAFWRWEQTLARWTNDMVCSGSCVLGDEVVARNGQ